MPPMLVYQMHDEFKPYKYENFTTNLSNLRASVKKNLTRMQSDCLAYGNDITLLMQLRADNPVQLPPYPIWHKHKAKRLLKKDIDNNKHIGKAPADLHKERPEYQEFPLKVFRKHIYQELEERAKREHRFAKKKFQCAAPKPRATEVEADKLSRARRRSGS